MCMPKAPTPPPTPEPAAPPAPPPASVEPTLKSGARMTKSRADNTKKSFKVDSSSYKSTPSKTTASGLQINK